MRQSRLDSLPEHGVAIDSETYLITNGNVAPKQVCGSAGWLAAGPTIEGTILDVPQTLELFAQSLEDPDTVIAGANITFDLIVFANECAKQGLDAMPAIFAAFENDKIYDLQIAEALHAIAGGHLGNDPRTGGQLKDPISKRPGRYSLSIVTDLVLGRTDAKQNDEYRLRYGELDGIPMSEWPQSALDYPRDDAKNTIEICLAQTGHLPKTSPHHNWTTTGECSDCGATTLGVQCLTKRPHRNLHEVSNRTYTAFALGLGSAWGFSVNQSSVDAIERHALLRKTTGIVPFTACGLVRPDGSENRSDLKRRVAVAYGSTEPCEVCAGTGKVPSPANPKSKIICFRDGPGGERIKTCDGTGLVIASDVPRSEKEGIGYGRDVLHESGDEFLMSYGEYQEDNKTLDVYVPYLRKARACMACGHNGTDDDPHTCSMEAYTYNNIPLTLYPNAVLETGRVSYNGAIQLFPRKAGFLDKETGERVPSLRECITARPGCLFSSEDFKAGELYTHGQSNIWLVGHSDLALALLRDIDPHSALAATVLGVSYTEFLKHKKEPKYKNARQAAKPFTFGKPGGMGSSKLVAQQRKQGPDTPCEGGPSLVDDGSGNKVPGYKGLRFCILMNNATSCGSRKVTEWGKYGRERKIPPTCVDCLDCAERLGDKWLDQWSENRPYFKFINECIDQGMTITKDALERWPHLRDVYRAGQQLAPGEIMQHVSGRIRGGLEYCAAANGFFQGLLGDVATSALRRVARECYDRTVRVPEFAHPNSKRSRYADGPSPLLGSRPIGYFHDELFLEHPESMGHDGALRASEIMVEEISWYCPDVAATCAAEPTLMKVWNKNAAAVWQRGGDKPVDADDRLIPWEPSA